MDYKEKASSFCPSNHKDGGEWNEMPCVCAEAIAALREAAAAEAQVSVETLLGYLVMSDNPTMFGFKQVLEKRAASLRNPGGEG